MKKWFRAAAFAVVLSVAVSFTYHVLSWKDTMGPHLSSAQQFYATGRDLIDVLFIGSSHVYGGINPDVLWREFGISSFDLAVSGQDKDSSYYYLKEALRTQSPKVVFVDLYAAAFEKGAVEGNVYRNMISIRGFDNSVHLIRDYFGAYDTDYLLRWPIIHTRYHELEPYDFVQYPFSIYGRGFCCRYTISPFEPDLDTYHMEEATPISDSNRAWIDGLYELSRRSGFSLVFLQMPYQVLDTEQTIFNGIYPYLEEKGIPLLQFNDLAGEVGLDYTQDFMDYGHLNIFGAAKATRYIGNYLTMERSDLELPDHRGDKAYEVWDLSAEYGDHLALWELLPATETPETYAGAIGALRHVTTVLVMSRMAVSDQWVNALTLIGAPPEMCAAGGICVIRDGKVLAWFPPQEEGVFNYDLNKLHTLHVRSRCSDDRAVNAEVEIGTEWIWNTDFDGLGFYVYDNMIETLIDAHVFTQ